MSKTSTSAGFTLIEVVVALTITSLILMLTMNGALEAKERQRRADERDEAVLLAASLVTQQSAIQAGPSERTGKTARLSWTLTETELARDPRGYFVLDRIEVRLFDRNGKPLYAVATRKLKPSVSP
jgi:prepilin-type N-terminal cleavage/methylation domain-containing protein